MIRTVPAAVRDLVSQWRAGGSRPQAGMNWPREQWVRALPEYANSLLQLPDKLDRDAVRDACSRAATDPIEARAAFIAAMAWGYGVVGYGRYRTQRVLLDTPDAGQRLIPWALPTYKRYLDHMHAWALTLDCRVDDLEEQIFQAAVSEGPSQWMVAGTTI